jgi:non-canonical (house-cleaning) NTP pyrophosphatase
MSPGFEWPHEVLDLIQGGLDGSQAFKKVGLTDHDKVGTADGAIHILTHGKINRIKLNELAITMALVQMENPEHYSV